MFKTVKRIIDWCGELKGRLYAGFVFSFFSHIFAAMPLMVAAYTVGLLIDAQKGGAAFDTSWIWKCIVIQIEVRQRGPGAGGQPDVPERADGLFHGAGVHLLLLQHLCQP